MSIDDKYIKVSPREHVLLKPSMYLGDINKREEENYIYEDKKIIKKNINWSPAFYKIFDEIIVNVYDQTIRDKTLKNIKINLNKDFIEVSNDGIGIDIKMHKKHKVYIPELIFGQLMSSSNFDKNEERITGGTHGLGAKLTNIFSKKFKIEVKDTNTNLIYKQTFKDNLSIIEKPIIESYNGKIGGFSVKYYPDFEKFGMTELDEDQMKLFEKRAYDLAGLTEKNVYINNYLIEDNNWIKYLKLYDSKLESYECNKYWNLGYKIEANAYQVSFVNGIFTNKNGKHVDLIYDQIYEKYSKKFKDISKKWLKNNLTLILKTSIVNPSFNSQTKEELMTPYSKFGIKCELDKKFFSKINEDEMRELLKKSTNIEFTKTDATKKSRIKNIPKLEDANYAGTNKSNECTLILTEGDSAKATAISGISAIKNGRNYYGVFPLRGKLLNVRDIPINKINKNEEITNLKKILGLKSNVTYNKENVKDLRYTSIMLMMDADEDGSHIKGLLLNFISYFYPSLLKIENFIKVLTTPVIKVSNKNNVISFQNLSSYNIWKKTNDYTKFKIKYYKGLGTSTSKEANEYFSNIDKHLYFINSESEDHPNPSLELVFNKKMADNRKIWLSNYDPEKILDFSPNLKLTVKKFINLEFKHFSNYDNIRSIPSLIDGFKPSQRKVLYSCFKKNLYDEIKVAQLAGYVSENTAYHHGEASLISTIINMAQDYMGSNNLNLLLPNGQFGTRLLGGKDHSSARYIFTELNKIVKLIFKLEDEGILNYLEDDGMKIEPKEYYPIIPFILVNGCEGIGTGFSSFIPNYNINEIIEYLINMIDNNKNIKLNPYYNNFKGKIIKLDSESYLSKGLYKIENNKLIIYELPIKSWTSDYKEFLEDLIYNKKSPFSSYKNLSSEKEVLFEIKINEMDEILNKEKHKISENINELEKYMNLTKSFKISNMHLFNENYDIIKYDNVYTIIKEFYKIRLKKYSERKKLLLELLSLDLLMLENKYKWINSILTNKVNLLKSNQEDLIKYLNKNNYVKKSNSFDYLLNVSIKEMSKDNLSNLKEKITKIKKNIESLKNKTPEDIWRSELLSLKNSLN